MVEAVRARGGEAIIFSSMHESGQQLDQISGIAAILTYPLDVEIVEMEEREEKERLSAIGGDDAQNGNNAEEDP